MRNSNINLDKVAPVIIANNSLWQNPAFNILNFKNTRSIQYKSFDNSPIDRTNLNIKQYIQKNQRMTIISISHILCLPSANSNFYWRGLFHTVCINIRFFFCLMRFSLKSFRNWKWKESEPSIFFQLFKSITAERCASWFPVT